MIFKKYALGARDVAQAVKHLLRKCEALSSNPSIVQKKSIGLAM
jgi:hypothetical protein